MRRQSGVIRTNCVDCLDRTNAFQTKIAFLSLKHLAQILGQTDILGDGRVHLVDEAHDEGTFMEAFKNIWADNGDHISKIYTGTGATTSSTTRKGKGRLIGLIDHKLKSLGRFYIGNFEDNHKQKAINILLGKNMDNNVGNDRLEQELEKMEDEFVTRRPINIGILTWSAYVESSQINTDLIKRLLSDVHMPTLDMFIVGLQDVVKSGGFKIFGSDAKDYAAKYEQEFLRYFKSMDITLKKYASHHSGGSLG